VRHREILGEVVFAGTSGPLSHAEGEPGKRQPAPLSISDRSIVESYPNNVIVSGEVRDCVRITRNAYMILIEITYEFDQ